MGKFFFFSSGLAPGNGQFHQVIGLVWASASVMACSLTINSRLDGQCDMLLDGLVSGLGKTWRDIWSVRRACLGRRKEKRFRALRT